jgi:hypothetical protein
MLFLGREQDVATHFRAHRQEAKCLIHIEAAALDRLRAMRRPSRPLKKSLAGGAGL